MLEKTGVGDRPRETKFRWCMRLIEMDTSDGDICICLECNTW